MMHANGTIPNSLSDVFPSVPIQDNIVSGSIGNVYNSNIDVASRMKYLGLNLNPQMSQAPGASAFVSEDRSRTNLIINYLPQSFDQTDLQRLFERVGPIRQCKLIRDKNTGASLCYGFVDFVNPQHAALAIQTYHGYETEQKRLRVAYASSGGRRFTPGHRLPAVNGTSSLGVEITNENVIGWEVFVVGIPPDWTENDLQRLFMNFGNVLLLRLLAPQLTDSPPSHKVRINSPVLNGASSDVSSDSVDSNRLTTTASVIFEERISAEQAVIRLNGYHAPDWSAPLRLRIIGSVTRETYGTFCFPSRHSPALAPSRLPNSQNSHDVSNESDVLGNLMNRKAAAPGCLPTGAFPKNIDSMVLTSSGDPHLNPPFSVPPRAIMRSKPGEASSALNHLPQGHPLELLDLLDNHSVLSSSSSAMFSASGDRINGRDMSLVNTFASRVAEQDHSKLDSSFRTLPGAQQSPWTFSNHRSLLSSLPDTASARTADSVSPAWQSGAFKRLSMKTPVIPSPFLSHVASQRGGQVQIWLKLENVQPTGSFKIRGMENVCRKWAASGVTHIVCPSGGNAALAAAYCAQAYGLVCTIVVPESMEAIICRRLAIEAPDAKVVAHGYDWVETSHRAEQLVHDLQALHPGESTVRLLHPYDQPDLWEGYETIIDELNPEMGQPDAIVLAVGGGGLLAGIIQGLWNRGWSSTHVIAAETEGTDCLNRSLKAGQLLLLPRSTTIATSLVAPVLAHRSWNLAQLQSLTPVTCSDVEALDAVKHFIDDHGMLVEPACGAALSTIYSGALSRLQLEGRIPRPANVVVIVGGGRNVSMRQLAEWENQIALFPNDHLVVPSFLTPLTTSGSFLPHATSSLGQDLTNKASFLSRQDPNETLKVDSSTPSTPRAAATTSSIISIVTAANNTDNAAATEGIDSSSVDGNTLNPHDLVNFSKLLAPSEGEADEAGLRD